MKQLHSFRLVHCAGLLMVALLWLANSSNPPNGRTGAPFLGEGNCNQCHGGNNPNGYDGDVTISGMPGIISPNTTYPLSITMTPTAGNPIKGGFQLVSVDGSNINAGDLTASNTQSGTETQSGREYLEHRGAKTFGGNPITWDFTWKSPASVAGNIVKFYFIGNFTNGNNNDTGDRSIAFSETYDFSGLPPLTASITNTSNVTCNGSNNGSATVTPSGGTTPYTYLWSNGQTSQTAVNLMANNYTVTVTASGGGTATATVTINQPTAMVVNTNVSGTLSCNQNSVTVTANASGGVGPYTYAWSNGNTGNAVSYTVGGSQSVTVTDGNDCAKESTFNIQENNAPPNLSATGGTLTCTQPTTTVNATSSTSGVTYFWNGPNGFTSNQQNATVSLPGNYTVTGTNPANGCTNTATVAVSQNTTAPYSITATPSGSLTCATTSIQVNSTTNAPNATFNWTGPNGFTATTQNITVQVPGNYTVVVTSSPSGCTVSAVATVLQNITPPIVTATASGPLTCRDTIILVTATTNGLISNVVWTGPSGFTIVGQNISVKLPGNYTVVATSATNGCTAAATATVIQNTTPPTASIATPGILNCINTTVQLNASASSQGNNFTYQWTTANGNITAGPTTLTPTVNTAGTYKLVITNIQNGCTASANANVSQTPAVSATIVASTQVSCNGGHNGSATIQATGGTGGYTYLWSTGATTATANNLSVGNYIVTITSANSCTATITATISQPAILLANASATAQMNNGVNDGTATAAPSGGTGNYTYNWSNSATTANIIGLAPGNYTVTITDAHGCTAAQTVTVNSINCNIAATTATNQITCHGAANGNASVTVAGATLPVTYVWSNGATTASINNLAPGSYTVSVTDANGCPAVSTAIITEPAVLAATTSVTAVTAVNVNDGHATTQPTGGTAPYTYLWTTGATTSSINGLIPGNYTVTITDTHACTVIQTVTVNAFNCTLITNITTTNATCPEIANGSATVAISGGTAPYAYLWSNGSTTTTAANLLAGTYMVTVSDAVSCFLIDTAIVVAVDTIAPVLLCPADVFLCSPEVVDYPLPAFADNCSLSGVLPILISGQTSGTTFPVGTKTQVFSVTDAAGNTGTCSFTVDVSSGANIVINSVQNDSGNNGIGSIDIAVFGGDGPYIFTWEKDGVFFSNSKNLTGLQAGIYILTVIDAHGCEVTLDPIIIDNIVGTVDLNKPSPIRVYPNPAQKGIWVKMNEVVAFSAEIRNTQGRLVQTITPTDLTDFLSVEHLSAGVYYLKIMDAAGKTWVVRWVKGG